MIERRTVFKAAAAAGSAGLLAACSGTTGGEATVDPANLPPKAKITVEPAVDAKDVSVLQPVTVKVSEGALSEVKVTNADGGEVAGELDEAKTTWTSTEPLGYGKTYTYAAKAKGTDGKVAELTGSFATLNPASVVRATLNPVDDAEVGVGMPVSVKFAAPISDRAAAQRALTVETSNQVEGSWAWLSDQQVDWRPKEYWPRAPRSRSPRSSTACTTAAGPTARPTSAPSS